MDTLKAFAMISLVYILTIILVALVVMQEHEINRTRLRQGKDTVEIQETNKRTKDLYFEQARFREENAYFVTPWRSKVFKSPQGIRGRNIQDKERRIVLGVRG